MRRGMQGGDARRQWNVTGAAELPSFREQVRLARRVLGVGDAGRHAEGHEQDVGAFVEANADGQVLVAGRALELQDEHDAALEDPDDQVGERRGGLRHDEAPVGETHGTSVPDDHWVEDADADEIADLEQAPRPLHVVSRGRGVARRMSSARASGGGSDMQGLLPGNGRPDAGPGGRTGRARSLSQRNRS